MVLNEMPLSFILLQKTSIVYMTLSETAHKVKSLND